jgi:hypothetical protein
MSVYLAKATHDALIESLLNVKLDPVTGKIEADAIKIALGEIGDLWPDTIRSRE